MENLFAQNNSSSNFTEKKNDNIEEIYSEIFLEASSIIRKEINKFKPENPCLNCTIKNCKIDKKDVFTEYPLNCEYRNWQLKILSFLTGEYREKLKKDYKDMMSKKDKYKCNKCGCCCELATSAYSIEQLKQQANRGNEFAKDFVSIYVPYKSEEEAKATNPEYFDKLNQLVTDDKIYYYHCSKLKNNLCTIYDKRPNICKDFPKNPLKLLPSNCSYIAWTDEISHAAMLLNAKVDIIEYYKGTLK